MVRKKILATFFLLLASSWGMGGFAYATPEDDAYYDNPGGDGGSEGSADISLPAAEDRAERVDVAA